MKILRSAIHNTVLVSSFFIILSFLLFTPKLDMDLTQDDISLQSIAMVTKTVDANDIVFEKYRYEKSDIAVCSSSSVKSYMSYKKITTVTSAQYRYIRTNMYVDIDTGLLRHKEHPDYVGVALGTYFGKVGDMFEFTLDSGNVIKAVMVDIKSDRHTYNRCYHREDNSVIEFVIDPDIAVRHYGMGGNGYIMNGNFNNASEFSGKIISVKKVTPILN